MRLTTILALAIASVLSTVHAQKPKAPGYSPYDHPYANRDLYVPRQWKQQLETTYKSFVKVGDKASARKVRRLQKEASTHIWIDSVDAIEDFKAEVSLAAAEEHAAGRHGMVQFVVNNIPDRDCTSATSTGDFSFASSGASQYATFIKNITSILKAPENAHLTWSVIFEPGLLHTTMNHDSDRCRSLREPQHGALTAAVGELVKTLISGVNVAIYLDLADSLTLGPDKDATDWTLKAAADIVYGSYNNGQLLIRGFSLNIGGYNPLSATAEQKDSAYASDAELWSEAMFIESMQRSMHNVYLDNQNHFLIDQGLAGVRGLRKSGEKGCNVKGAGLGELPRSLEGSTVGPKGKLDAVVWAWHPGTSQGGCGNGDPDHGAWFDTYAQTLVKKAQPAVEQLVD